jgi:hypothetical protein
MEVQLRCRGWGVVFSTTCKVTRKEKQPQILEE